MRVAVALVVAAALAGPLPAAPPPAPDVMPEDGLAEEPPADVAPFADEESETPPIPPEYGGAIAEEEEAYVPLPAGAASGRAPLPPPVEAGPPAYDVPPTPALDNQATERAQPLAPAAPILGQ